jgi:alkylation response protein AidB-like acyl-CoA dehydrogenase
MSSLVKPVADEAAAMREAFVDTATRFCARGLAPRVDALDVVTLAKPEQQALQAALDEAGLCGMALPEAAGGMGLDALAVGAVLARIAQTCSGTALRLWAHESALLALAEAAHGGECPALPAGAVLGNALLSPPVLRAQRGQNGWVLHGDAPWAWGGGIATHLLVAAETDAGGVLAVVAADAAGLRVTQSHARIGLRACPSQAIDFENVPAVAFIELPPTQYAVTLGTIRATALGLCGAIAAGNARGALRRAVAYARERYQGGDIIIEHTLVQGMLGNSLAQLRAAEALVERGLANGGDDALLARVVATRHGEQVCLDAVQVFGGNGYMRDYGVEKHLRDAKMLALVGGGNERLLQALVAAHRNEEQWP